MLQNMRHLASLFRNRLNSFDLGGVAWEEVRRAAAGLSFADIARAAGEAAKSAVLEDRTAIETGHLVETLGERSAINANDTRTATPP